MLRLRPIQTHPAAVESKVRKACYRIITSQAFENGIMLAITANIAIMAMAHDGETEGFKAFLRCARVVWPLSTDHSPPDLLSSQSPTSDYYF